MNASIKLRVANLCKIFGPSPDHALQLLREGRDRDAILEQTGNVLAVSDVSFEVRTGEVFVVMGLSGSGKSTLIRCINRLVEPTSGNIYIDAEDIVGANAERLRQVRLSKLAMVFQHFALFPHKSVVQNVEFGLKIRGVDRAERRQRALGVLDQVGLKTWADSLPSSLSGGMQQRVGLARSLAVEPDILLMDEAFSALDPLIRREMQDELLALQRKLKRTIVFITHDLHEALILGDRVAIMKDGRFVQVATPQEIVSDPADDYVSAFTRDVDRSRILTTDHVLSRTQTLKPAEAVGGVLTRMKGSEERYRFVVDDEGRPEGLVQLEQLRDVSARRAVGRVMVREFPRALTGTRLIELYPMCARGLPVAIVDRHGSFLGSVDPSDVFTRVAATTTDRDSQESE